jgi:hypothetical protein
VNLNEETLVAAILTVSAVRRNAGVEEVVQKHAAIRDLLQKKDRESFTVPEALAPLFKQALEMKASRERKA